MAKYPEPKTRDLSEVEKAAINQHLDAGDDNVYSLAHGLAAARHR